MRIAKTFPAAVLAMGASMVGVSLLTASGQGFGPQSDEPLVVRAFRTGPLTQNTIRFLPVGGRDATDVMVYDALLFVFSEPIDPLTLNNRTVRIRPSTETGLGDDAKGVFYRYEERWFDPISDTYIPAPRTHKTWWYFDPAARFQGDPNFPNPAGFDPNTTYSVIIPGTDMGARWTVRTRDGHPLARTFRTTFRTGSPPPADEAFDWPHVEGVVEATDGPGIPLDGRTGVDPHASIVVRFSKPILPPSFVRASTRFLDGSSYNVLYNDTRLGRLKRVRVTVEPSPDLMTYSFRPPRRGFPPNGTITFLVTANVADRSGGSLGGWGPAGWEPGGVWLQFQTGAGP